MKKHLKQLDLKRIRITDSLFGEYVNKVSEKIIPHQWKILNDQLEDSEPTYCIHNFRIAAGEEKGERKGVVFQDTDLYKWLEAVAYTIAGGRGEHLEELADQVIDLIGKAQEPDGYGMAEMVLSGREFLVPDRGWNMDADPGFLVHRS